MASKGDLKITCLPFITRSTDRPFGGTTSLPYSSLDPEKLDIRTSMIYVLSRAMINKLDRDRLGSMINSLFYIILTI